MSRSRLPAKLRQEIIWSGPCAYCGDVCPTEVDHIIPVTRGGTDDRDNLAPACHSCNMDKLDFTLDEWRELRETSGQGWPPKSRGHVFMEIWREEADRRKLSEDEAYRLLDKLIEGIRRGY